MDLRAAGVTGMRREGLGGDGGRIGGEFEGFTAVMVDELEVVDVIGNATAANCRRKGLNICTALALRVTST